MDHYYAEAVKEIDAKPFQPRPSREIAIGKNVDSETRQDLKRLFDRKGIPYGPGKGVAINNRDYTDQNGKAPYRVPDLRIGEVKVGNLTIDWTIRIKQPEDSQIWDFVHAESQPKGVIIVIPSQRFPPGARYIPRAAVLKGIALCLSHIHF